MVLKFKFILIILLYISSSFATNYGELFYTDKYDANYYSSESTTNTHFYIGSDLFKFMNQESVNDCTAFIDSFLIKEELFYKQIKVINGNTIDIELEQINATECRIISNNWNENYRLEFQKKLHTIIKEKKDEFNNLEANEIMLGNVLNAEFKRFYNPSNNVININSAFVIPEKHSSNDFKKSFTHHNTRRFTTRETQIVATNILYNSNLKPNEIKYNFPSLNKQIFVKNCISLHILELLLEESISFKTDYSINQCVSSFVVTQNETDIKDLSIFINLEEIDSLRFNELKYKAFDKIVNITKQSLFYYSYYDIEKLKLIMYDYSFEIFKTTVSALNNRKKYILEIAPESNYTFLGLKLESTNTSIFNVPIEYKNNSTSFVNKTDTNKINSLILFLELNKNYNLIINGIAKKNEYLFIEKAKRDSLVYKYQNQGYIISKKKDIALYRSLLIFDELVEKNIHYNRLKCTGRKEQHSHVELDLFIQD